MLILSCLFLSVGLIYSQTITVNGIVVDDAGIEVVGASVVVKGTTTGVATDVDGKFSLNVPSNSTLVFSLVGMKKKEMKATPNMNVVMESDEAVLDEVMVVAYGTVKKSQFTGSAARVGSDAIKDVQAGSITKSLAGRMSGVQVSSTSGRPGADAVIRVRGTGSINAVSTPLYVVDGVPYEGALNAINPRDIESMTVLKDAAANSLYGARGSNGVILITTKTGGGPGRSSKARITVDTKWGSNSLGTPLYDMIDDSGQYYETAWRALRNQQVYNLGASPAAAGLTASSTLVGKMGGYNSFNVPNQKLIDPNTGKLNPEAVRLYQDNWKDEILKTGFRQEYQVGISGASDKTSYLMSMSYLGDEGIIPNSEFNRFTGRVKVDQFVNSWLKVGANMSYARTKTKFTADGDGTDFNTEGNTQGNNAFYTLQSMGPIYPIYEYDAEGNRLLYEDGQPIYDFGSGDYNSKHKRPVGANANPIGSQLLDQDKDRSNTFSGQAYVEARFLNDFKFTANLKYDNQDNYRLDYLNGLYGQFADNRGISSRITRRTTGLTANQLLTWVKQFGDHSVDVLAGHESYQFRYNYAYASKRQFYDLSNVELDGAVSDPQSSSSENNYRVESYLSRVQYDYLSKYFLSASFRTDGSSLFYKDERWGQFWSVGGSWLVTKENFMQNIEWLDELKYKMSYGTQGNDRLFALTDRRGVSPWANQYRVKPSGGGIALESDYVGNKNITWEKSKAFNTGIEFSIFNGRLSGGVEYFRKGVSDMLFYRKVPLSAGYAEYPDNIGDMVDQGVEIELNTNILSTKDWHWSVYLNATHISNEVTNLPGESKEEGISNGLFWFKEGKSRYDYYLADYVGTDENGKSMWYKDVLDANGDATGERVTTTKFSEATRYYQGCALPTIYGGLGSTVTWRDFDFSLHTAFQFGGTGYDYIYKSLMHGGEEGRAWHKDILNSWSDTNQNTDIPRLQAGDSDITQNYSNRWLISSDYFSIQNITLGYTFPKTLLGKLNIEALRVYGTAENLALFSKRKGYDPRQSITGVNAYGRYTPARTISFGLNLEF